MDRALIVDLQDDYIYLERTFVRLKFIYRILKSKSSPKSNASWGEGGGGKIPVVKNKTCKSTEFVNTMQVRTNGTLVLSSYLHICKIRFDIFKNFIHNLFVISLILPQSIL